MNKKKPNIGPIKTIIETVPVYWLYVAYVSIGTSEYIEY